MLNKSYFSVIYGEICFMIYSDVFFNVSSVVINESMGKNYRNFTLGFTYFVYGMGNLSLLVINLFVNDYI